MDRRGHGSPSRATILSWFARHGFRRGQRSERGVSGDPTKKLEHVILMRVRADGLAPTPTPSRTNRLSGMNWLGDSRGIGDRVKLYISSDESKFLLERIENKNVTNVQEVKVHPRPLNQKWTNRQSASVSMKIFPLADPLVTPGAGSN